jgi:hypothetical protein
MCEKMKKSNILFVLIFLVGIELTFAGGPIAVFGDWTLFKTTNRGERLFCYMVSIPQKRYDNFNKRGQSFFNVIVEKDKSVPEVYLSFGQILNKDIISAELDIVKRKFPIFTREDKAWAYNSFDDINIIAELKKSAIFSVSIEYENGKKLIDIYSLNGFNEAYDELLKICE